MKKIILLSLVFVMVFGISAFAFDQSPMETETKNRDVEEVPDILRELGQEIREITKENRDLKKQIMPPKISRMHRFVEKLLDSGDIVPGSDTENRLKEMDAKFHEKIDEFKEEYPEEFKSLEENKEILDEYRSDLKELKGTQEFKEFEKILENVLEIKLNNNEILKSLLDKLTEDRNNI